MELHLPYRWFCEFDLDDALPHHSTFAVHRLGRFRERDVLRGDIEAVAIARSAPDSFVRQSVKGAHIRKIDVTVSPKWLDQEALASSAECAEALRFQRGHLTTRRWKATPRLIALAEQILNPPHLAELLIRLYLESRSIEMVAEALQAITDTPAGSGLAAVHPAYRRAPAPSSTPVSIRT